MSNMDLESLKPPYFQIVVGSGEQFGQYSYKLNYESRSSQFAVRVVRGNKMKRLDDLFDEFSAALQFPNYFGENYPAFDECICDLEWLPAKGYVLLIPHSANLLSEEPVERNTFVRILAQACRYWATEPHAESPVKLEPTPFHILFHATESEVQTVREFLNPAHPDTPTLQL